MHVWHYNLTLTRRETIKLLVLPTSIVLAAFLVVTIWGWRAARDNLRQETTRNINIRTSSSEDAINKRLSIYDEILRGAVGLFNASDQVTSEDWRRYIENFELQQRYPGLRSVGYTKVLKANEVEAFVAQTKANGTPSFTITPEGARDTYTAVLYLEPLDDVNRAAIGYDMFAEPTRQAAMVRARDTGQPTFTERLLLRQQNVASAQPGFIMYIPVYKKNLPHTTTSERQANVDGYVYAAFRASDLFNGILQKDADNQVGFQIYVNEINQDSILYTSRYFDGLKTHSDSLARDTNLNVYGVNWKIHYQISAEVVAGTVRTRPLSVLIWGVFFSIVIAASVLRLLLSRATTLSAAKDQEIQLAKDDLLSMASHQLRTPATGVKQYLGMVLEGYAGPLKAQQKTYLQKAYTSNERQLHIINELLYTAKADAGRIVLAKVPLNLNKLIKEITNEQRTSLKEQKHNLDVILPKKPITVNADPHCLRMSLDNLLSNAIKYTKPGGKIVIRATKHRDHVTITVKDTGVGIDKQDISLLFKQFTRIPNELTSQTSGSGIGLYLASHLIKLHGGSITAESKRNKGSTFKIVLPLN